MKEAAAMDAEEVVAVPGFGFLPPRVVSAAARMFQVAAVVRGRRGTCGTCVTDRPSHTGRIHVSHTGRIHVSPPICHFLPTGHSSR